MMKVLLLALTPFLLLFLNNYFKNKEQRDIEKARDKEQQRRKQHQKKEVTYKHKWDEE